MTVTKNKVVSINYTLTDDNNNLLDSTSGQEPLEYLHGFENIIPGLENALEGKSPGDHFSVKIPAADAYGKHDKDLITDIPRENFSEFESIDAGMQFHAHTPAGVRLFTVVEAGGHTVTVDGNHPLAGMDLTFDVTVAAVREASEQERSHGHVHNHHHEGGGCCGQEGCNDDCACGSNNCGAH
ncbi:MAG: peptidylprolyl isomerase [Treponema sp.]|jgi:FKBP-type peptidyl-prolyl cis-trans isomerase SlyD|nr:peptidylprolyl isomerase [Treponema sp.]